MKIWYNSVVGTDRRVLEIQGDRLRIGRGQQNELVLESPFVADEAAVLYRRGSVWELVVLGMNGVSLGEKRLFNGDRFEIRSNQQIGLFPFTLTLDLPADIDISREARRRELDEQLSQSIRDAHLELLLRLDLRSGSEVQGFRGAEQLLRLERTIDEIVRAQQKLTTEQAELTDHVAGHGLRDTILAELTEVSDTPSGRGSALLTDTHWSRIVSQVPEREIELMTTADYVKQVLKIQEAVDLSARIETVERGFWPAWEQLQGRVHREFKEYLALRHFKKEVKDIVFGYGPLEDLLRLPTISEIMVVDREHIYIERNGVLENSGRRFISDDVIEAIIQRIVAKVGRRIDKSQPLVDARLSDGSRVNAVIPPLAVSGPCLTIRKFPSRRLLIDDLVKKGALTRTVAEFLRAIVLARKNVLISGGTGTGKTTLLNCLSDFIPDKERIVTVEDTAELQLAKEHVVRLETKDANVEGKGEFTIRNLVKNALRMRPDRIVVGECRGPEALDMLQAMNTGHDGSMTTIHANSSIDVVLRLEVLVQMASNLPIESIRQQVATAIDIVVQLKRMRDGRRCISQVTEVVRVDPSTGNVELRDLFVCPDEERMDSTLEPTGSLPTFIDQLIAGKMLDLEAFYHD